MSRRWILSALPCGVPVAISARYELATVPSGFLYDRNQELRATRRGFDPEEADAREQEIVDLLAEKVE